MAANNLKRGAEMLKQISIEPKTDALKKCFKAAVDGKQVNLDLEAVRLILRKHFKIKLLSLQPGLASILPYILVYHIKNWPGWARGPDYHRKDLPFDTWYGDFINFLTGKVEEAIKKYYKEIMEQSHNEQEQACCKIADKSTQTDNSAPKSEAPFRIEVTGKAHLLTTTVFTDNNDGDIILKTHDPVEWQFSSFENFSIKQIMTWPHVGVHMFSPIFDFSRKNLHEFQRYVSLVMNPLPPVTVDFIDSINTLKEKQKRCCYTVDYVREFSLQFLKAFDEIQLDPVVRETFQVAIEEFLTDIEELDVLRDEKPSIASNTSVLFNVGKCVYFRNKKLSKGSPPSRLDVGYTEIIIPKMETSFIQMASPSQRRIYLDHLRIANKTSRVRAPPVLPQITFSCDFCETDFNTLQSLLKHFLELHKMEPPMLCSLCKKTFSVVDLTKDRWKHECGSSVARGNTEN